MQSAHTKSLNEINSCILKCVKRCYEKKNYNINKKICELCKCAKGKMKSYLSIFIVEKTDTKKIEKESIKWRA